MLGSKGPAKTDPNKKDGKDASLYGTLKEGIKSVPNTLKTLVNIGTKSRSELDTMVKKKLKEKGRNDKSKGPSKKDPLLSDMQEALQNPKVYKKGKRKGLRKAKRLAKK